MTDSINPTLPPYDLTPIIGTNNVSDALAKSLKENDAAGIKEHLREIPLVGAELGEADKILTKYAEKSGSYIPPAECLQRIKDFEAVHAIAEGLAETGQVVSIRRKDGHFRSLGAEIESTGRNLNDLALSILEPLSRLPESAFEKLIKLIPEAGIYKDFLDKYRDTNHWEGIDSAIVADCNKRIKNASIDFDKYEPTSLKIGEEELSPSQALGEINHSDDRERRRVLSEALDKEFADVADKQAENIIIMVKARYKQSEARAVKAGGMGDTYTESNPHLAFLNRKNTISSESVDDLVNAVCSQELQTIMKDFYALKAKVLGVDELKPYDVMVPVGKLPHFTPEEGMEIAVKAAHRISPEYGDRMKAYFESGAFDWQRREDKDDKAVYTNFPREGQIPATITFDGSIIDVLKLAHEGMHAIHEGKLRETNTPKVYRGMTIPTTSIEVPTELIEQQVFEVLLVQTPDIEQRIGLLGKRIDMCLSKMRATHTYFQWEKGLYDKLAKGEDLTVDFVKSSWRELAKRSYGDAVNFNESDYFSNYFAYNSMPFYEQGFNNYYYTASMAVAMVLSEQINKNSDSAFPQKFDDFMMNCGRRPFSEMLGSFGGSKAVFGSAIENINVSLQELQNEFQKPALSRLAGKHTGVAIH